MLAVIKTHVTQVIVATAVAASALTVAGTFTESHLAGSKLSISADSCTKVWVKGPNGVFGWDTICKAP